MLHCFFTEQHTSDGANQKCMLWSKADAALKDEIRPRNACNRGPPLGASSDQRERLDCTGYVSIELAELHVSETP